MPDQEPVDDIERLRRVAYSRDGSVGDRERLAELERARRIAQENRAVVGPPSGVPHNDEIGEDADPAAVVDTPAAPSRVLVAVVAGLIGLAVGAGAVWAGSRTTPSPAATHLFDASSSENDGGERGDPLDIFQRPLEPGELDDFDETLLAVPEGSPEGSVQVVDVRRLGVIDRTSAVAFAARVIRGEAPIVCLTLVIPANSAAGGCTALSDFRQNGLQVSLNELAVRWGPDTETLWTTTDFNAPWG
jgi:hypothetical protein